jgi:hypothetical protein
MRRDWSLHLHEADPYFPNDEEERYYTVYIGSSLEKATKVSDMLEVSADQDLTQSQMLDIIGPEGHG